MTERDISAGGLGGGSSGNTVSVRFALVCMLAIGAFSVLAPRADASTAAGPSLHVANDPSLVLVGAGFEPGAVVRLRVTGPGVDRGVTVRTSGRGTFASRFAGLVPCSITQATATAPSGARAK